MPNLGSLWYTMSIKDLTDTDLKKINEKLKNAGAKILLTPELVKSVSEILPRGLKLKLDPQLKAVTNEMLAKAAEGKVMTEDVVPIHSDNQPNIQVLDIGLNLTFRYSHIVHESCNRHLSACSSGVSPPNSLITSNILLDE